MEEGKKMASDFEDKKNIEFSPELWKANIKALDSSMDNLLLLRDEDIPDWLRATIKTTREVTLKALDSVDNPLLSIDEVEQNCIDAMNSYNDEIRFIQEMHHRKTGEYLPGCPYPQGRLKTSDIPIAINENGEKK